MAFGLLTEKMKDVLKEHIQGKEVWDLGAGDLTRSLELLEVGAGHVFAVDKQIHLTPLGGDISPDYPVVSWGERQQRWHSPDPDITPVRALFRDLEVKPRQVVLLSWPVNWPMPGLEAILDNADIVVYLGSNVNGSACGQASMFRKLAKRELLATVAHPRNTLLIYGPRQIQRGLTGEEIAAISGEMMTFEEAQSRAFPFVFWTTSSRYGMFNGQRFQVRQVLTPANSDIIEGNGPALYAYWEAPNRGPVAGRKPSRVLTSEAYLFDTVKEDLNFLLGEGPPEEMMWRWTPEYKALMKRVGWEEYPGGHEWREP